MVDGRTADWLGGAFYLVVASVALAGQTSAAVGWLHWPVATALPAVGALELGGIALAARADYRRRLGERAIAARLLSAAVAAFAVGFNWLGHDGNHLVGAFFAGMSALGYSVWLIQAGDRRRDQLRDEGKLPTVPPTYPAPMWLQHPLITRRARDLARADADLGLYGSLALARAQLRTQRRHAAIAKVLRHKIATSTNATMAQIAISVYDLDEIARRLAAGADYDRLTTLVAADLNPDRLLGDQPPEPTAPTNQHPTGDPVPGASDDQPPTRPTANRRARRANQPAHPDQPELVGRPRLSVVGEPAAVANARVLREIYGDDLPTVERQIRTRTGWSLVRVRPAVEAYRRGDDLKTNQPEPATGGEADPGPLDHDPADLVGVSA